MRSILRQFKYILILTISIGTVITVAVAYVLVDLQHSSHKRAKMNELHQTIFDLNVLAEDFFLTHSKRAEVQTLNKFVEIKQLLRDILFRLGSDPKYLKPVTELDRELNFLAENFKTLVGLGASSQSRDSQRAKQLSTAAIYRSHRMASISRQIQGTLVKDLDRTCNRLGGLLIATFILAEILIVTMLRSLQRRTTDSIAELRDGIKRIAAGEAVEMRDSLSHGDEFSGLLGEFREVSLVLEMRYRQLSEQLKRQMAAAERANDAKSRFLANVSHEIRTPLSIIDGYADYLVNPQDGQTLEFVDKIRWNVRYVVNLINEILDLTKVESGKMEKTESQFNLHDLSHLFSSLHQRAKIKNLKFEIRVMEPLPSQVKIDKGKLEQILMNVIGNAIKFTEFGGVRVEVYFSDCILSFVVHDSGEGIAEEMQSQLFTLFFQASRSLTRKTSGTGLGLVYSRTLARFLGGDVELVESSREKGSTFRVSLAVSDFSFQETLTELSLSQAPLSHRPRSVKIEGLPLGGVRILLAEDNPDLILLMQRRIEALGGHLLIADDGRKAVEMVTQAPEQFDLLLMDIQMPVMDGYTAARKVRASGFDKPIIACSARLMKEERDLGFQAGFSDYLEKPVESIRLLTLCMQFGLIKKDLETKSHVSVIAHRPRGLVSSHEGDPIFKDLIPKMARNLAEWDTTLHRVISARDSRSVKESLHQLKGMLSSYGFQPTADRCARLEQLEEISLEQAAELLADLQAIHRTYSSEVS